MRCTKKEQNCHLTFFKVGSDFNEASVGELKRADDNSKKLQMSLPHGNPKKVTVRISQSHTGKLGLGRQSFSEGVLGIETSNEDDQNTKGACVCIKNLRKYASDKNKCRRL